MNLSQTLASQVWHRKHKQQKKKANYTLSPFKTAFPQRTTSRKKKQPTVWEKIFAAYTANKGLVSRLCGKLLELNDKGRTSLKWAKRLHRRVSREDTLKSAAGSDAQHPQSSGHCDSNTRLPLDTEQDGANNKDRVLGRVWANWGIHRLLMEL